MLRLHLLAILAAAAAGDAAYRGGTEAADPGPSLSTVYQPGTAGADWSGEHVKTNKQRILQAVNPTSYTPGTPGATWSHQEILAIKAKLRRTFQMGGRGSIRAAHKALGLPASADKSYHFGDLPKAAKMLRLSFHDCVLYTDGTGGCDGCLDWAEMDTIFKDFHNRTYEDSRTGAGNNGLQPTVELLEAIYTVPDFPANSPILPTSLAQAGKSRADLWALAALVAVEWGVETNNLVCEDPAAYKKQGGQCHHQEGEAGCRVELPSPLQFRTGRADCLPTRSDRPYAASKQEVHPDAVAGGRETVQFFLQQFGLSGQETVALMGAHTFGRLNFRNSLFPYVWTAWGDQMFNNDYYKMITDKERWYLYDLNCTKVGDAHNQKPARRWTTLYRNHTKNGGPVHWISENYVCPNCMKSPNDHCCKNVPAGQFCSADNQTFDQSSPDELNSGCEKFRFISGVDEMALSCEMGLYFQFEVKNGFPTGCPGFATFDGKPGKSYYERWSNLPAGTKADPQCELQQLAEPAGAQPTSWYMQEYARDQQRWLADFTAALDKMQSNGYPAGLAEGPDQSRAVQCSTRSGMTYGYSQCSAVAGMAALSGEFLLQSQLDGKVLRWDAAQARLVMAVQAEDNADQRWQLAGSWQLGQLVNVATGLPLEVNGILAWQAGTPDAEGYFTIQAAGGNYWNQDDEPSLVGLDRGWVTKVGQKVNLWQLYDGSNQRWKQVLLDI